MQLSNNFQSALQVANNYGYSVVIKNNAIWFPFSEDIQDDLREADISYTFIKGSFVVPMCGFSEMDRTSLWK